MPSVSDTPTVRILGCRGIPAAHGGFETFAERLSLSLVGRGWRVVVYCQENVAKVEERFAYDTWNGVERVIVRVASRDPWDTFEFDWHSTRHAAGLEGPCLVLGYNTGIFLTLLRMKGRAVLTNMDGIEWRRPKWSWPVKAWFYVNERIAALLSHKLVADHPAIADHLATRRDRGAISMIPYGGDPVWSASPRAVEELGLRPGKYLISVARIEPDNSVDLIVRAFSRRVRDTKLVVLGRLDPENAYHRKVLDAAGDEVVFPGAIYDHARLQALRFHARGYCHGHTVGGTNPSLVEALWSGNPVIAHKNVYNVWTAGHEQFFFSDEDECDRLIGEVLTNDVAVNRASWAARNRALASFEWDGVTRSYERELAKLGGFDVPSAAVGGRVLPRGDYDLRAAAE